MYIRLALEMCVNYVVGIGSRCLVGVLGLKPLWGLFKGCWISSRNANVIELRMVVLKKKPDMHLNVSYSPFVILVF